MLQTHLHILDPLSCEDWDKRLNHHEKLSFFHSKAWAHVLFETYRYQPRYFCLLDSKRITNLLPVMEVKSFLTGCRGVSLPFTDYCEPLLTNGTDLNQMLMELKQYGQQHQWQSFQIRGGEGINAEPEQQYYVHELKLETNTEQLFSKLSSAKRRNVRKAQGENIEIRHAEDLAAVDAYYKLHCQTRKRHGTPPQPYRFFHNIFEHVISRGMGKVVLASHQKRIIAGSIFFHFRDQALYKFGSSDLSYQHLRPNDLIMWEAIRWYAVQRYRYFCFGRTAMDNTGLRRFKLDWGAIEKIVNYYRYDLRQQDYVTTPSAVKSSQKRIFQRLPITALKLVGSVAYRHMG
jgi:hypothetical protein